MDELKLALATMRAEWPGAYVSCSMEADGFDTGTDAFIWVARVKRPDAPRGIVGTGLTFTVALSDLRCKLGEAE